METENQKDGCGLSQVSEERLDAQVKIPALVRTERELEWGARHQKNQCKIGQQSERGLDMQAIGLDSQKSLGDIAEASFLAKASSLGFGVSKPCIEERYDFVLDSGYRLWRVQVKSTRTRTSSGYMVRVAGKTLAPYTEREIDFLVGYMVPVEAWYIIPVRLLKGLEKLFFYPLGRGINAKWEKYRDAWCQAACPLHESGPSKIVTPRCRDEKSARLALCPLKVLP
jgi:hypothetical protein